MNNQGLTTKAYKDWCNAHPDIDLESIARNSNIQVGALYRLYVKAHSISFIILLILLVMDINVNGKPFRIFPDWCYTTLGTLLTTAGLFIGLFLFYGIIYVIWVKIKRIDVHWFDKYFNDFVPACLNDAFDDVQFNRELISSENEVLDGLSLHSIKYDLTTEITGVYKGIPFRCINAKIYSNEKNGGLLDGCIISYGSGVSISNDILITQHNPKDFAHAFIKYKNKLETQTESVEFNDRFRVYGQGHDVFYVLNPRRIDALLALWNEFKPPKTVISYRTDRVVYGIFDENQMFDISSDAVTSKYKLSAIKILSDAQDDISRLKKILDMLYFNPKDGEDER